MNEDIKTREYLKFIYIYDRLVLVFLTPLVIAYSTFKEVSE